MSRMKRVVIGCLFVPLACGTDAPEQEPVDTPETPTMDATSGPAFLALHRYNPVSDELNERLLADLASLNQAVVEAGQPETGYQVWKVTGEQTGDHGYIFGSIWADRATYDAVHEHEAYTTAMAVIDEAGIETIQDQIYNRYVELSPPVADPVPLPEGDGLPILALHFFNLPSADSEGEFLDVLEELNAVVAATGHPESYYNLWKVTDEQAGSRAYLTGSVWADRATYDAVHEHQAYVDFMDSHREVFDLLVLDDLYNRYEPVLPSQEETGT